MVPDIKKIKGFDVDTPRKAVHLGARISDHDALRVMKVCSKIDIPAYKVRLAPHEYRMISEPLIPKER